MKIIHIALFSLFLAPLSSFAYDTNQSTMCEEIADKVEASLDLPKHLLKAIIHRESGRWHPTQKKNFPWPWTINYRGKSHFFPTKAKAIAHAQSLINQKRYLFDVGPAQMNYLHHYKSFCPKGTPISQGNLNRMFDPQTNILVAGKYLKSHKKAKTPWLTAAGHYHSKKPVHGYKYRQMIMKIWFKLRQRFQASDTKTRLAQKTTTQTTTLAPKQKSA